MRTVPSWSFKIIGKIITDNQYWKMWPIKLISDYQPIIGIMYCAFFLCKLVMRRTSQQSTTHVNMSRKNMLKEAMNKKKLSFVTAMNTSTV